MAKDVFTSPDFDLQGLSRASAKLLRFQQSLEHNGKEQVIKNQILDSPRQKKYKRPRHERRDQKRARKHNKHERKVRKLAKLDICSHESHQISSQAPEDSPFDNVRELSWKFRDSKATLLQCVMPCISKASIEEAELDLIQANCSIPESSVARILMDLSLLQTTKQQISRKKTVESRTREVTISTIRATLPLGIGKPRVWAQSRQELCEGLPYFRAFQSGIYTHNNLAMGYLLDAFVSARDHIGERVIISHGGGKACNSALDNGEHELREDQILSDRSIAGLINNHITQQPLVLIIGDKCPIAPSRIPHGYCVLDWFRVTHVWTERDDGSNHNIRYKFRFEKLTSEPGWWSPVRSGDPSPATEALTIRSQICTSCDESAPLIYQEHMCLNSQCARFWKIGHEASTLPLTLDDAFANSFTQTEIIAPFDLKPDPAVQDKEFYSGNDVSRVFWRGICCTLCGKLNSRIQWLGWKCSACDFQKMDARKIYGIEEVRDPFRPVYTGPPLCFDWRNPLCGLKFNVTEQAGTRTTRYFLGEDIGSVYHIACSNKLNAAADQIFKDYQTQDIDFRRRALKTRVDSQFLSAQFSHNAGMRYKYHCDAGTEDFATCAPVVNTARNLITEHVQSTCGPHSFNEILSVAYFEGQHMGYHDDGERDVSSVVASLSLGASAVMKFRPKRGKESLFFNELSLRKCQDDVQHDEVENSALKDDLPVSAVSRQPHGRDVLRLHLEHGDIMIMQGSNFQKLIEHSVAPTGFRIAATARHIIGPGVTMKQSELDQAQD